MTTEADPSIEVKESEKIEEQTAQLPVETETKANSDEPKYNPDQNSEQTPGSPSLPIQSSPGKQKKEKDSSESKGISRFIPPWLKKQKSQSQMDLKDNGEKKEQLKDIDKAEVEELEQPKEDMMKTEKEMEKIILDESEEAEINEKEEKHSHSSAEIQPAKEHNKEEIEYVPEENEEVQIIEHVKNETKEILTVEAKPEKISQKTPKKMKTIPCKVILLDGTEFNCEIEKRAKGQVVLDKVCKQLNLLEKDYFGLTFHDNEDQKSWLDAAKEIKRQSKSFPWLFGFNVKFYPPDPSQLTEDITRYFLCLQLRQDIASGRLPCSFVTHSLLGSYTLQAELGDYDPEEHSSDYISEFQFAPSQTKEMEDKVVELHKTHRGLTPALADFQFLENAKKLSMYGVDLHHAKDSEGVDIMLGVCANGLLIYKDRLRINRFAWPKILKISYKRSNFYIKVRPGELEQFESTIGFKLPNHRAAKRLWKVCVEHHTFFRLMSPEQPPKAKFLTLGSKFRYSGRTLAQSRQASTLIDRPAPYFERTSSKRVSRSLDGAPIGNITDQSPLKDFSLTPEGTTVDGAVFGPDVAAKAREDGSPNAILQLELAQDAKVGEDQRDFTITSDAEAEKSKSLRIEGENIYVRHSNLMLEDLDKTQDDLLKHQASISELKRSFMESTPEPRPNEWEKRRITPLSLQAQGSSDEIQNIVEEKKQAEIVIEETVVTEEVKKGANGKVDIDGQLDGQIPTVMSLRKKDSTSLSSSDSSSNSEDEGAEYQPDIRMNECGIREEPEEHLEDSKEFAAENVPYMVAVGEASSIVVTVAHVQDITEALSHEVTVVVDVSEEKNICEGVKQDFQLEEVEDQPKINGDVSHIDVTPQIISYSEPPVVKTEMVTISDAVQKMEISTKEVPIVQTETKTITYEASQMGGSGDSEPGILIGAQTITSESVSTTTTTHITKTVKGGIPETRIEKRIVITGDADIDHDEALAQAIKEAKEQHPDMSITRVVVHKETELTEEGEED
ncbi:band 4.1-like protein 2 isoform X4 [Rhinatrema bivittatum]|uniref:band 4.1-like protein 2 isoform X4 n=1 Tax=Rhinatrema bivittatum TaxID=194408 RepID=UPI00112D6E18|nr:band 4.1-like protein 2 isoform X4 [Rhinatrema bivittatum]